MQSQQARQVLEAHGDMRASQLQSHLKHNSFDASEVPKRIASDQVMSLSVKIWTTVGKFKLRSKNVCRRTYQRK